SLINFLQLRLCVLAAPEMQELAQRVKAIVAEKYPIIFKGIECRATPLGICPEPKSRSCGRYPTAKEIEALKK
ncbi:MAG: thymidylate synthase (FAD), partial [Candidatus Bathyarchaeia archaeon]